MNWVRSTEYKIVSDGPDLSGFNYILLFLQNGIQKSAASKPILYNRGGAKAQ